MKKLLFFTMLIFSLCFTANAGYVIRGIPLPNLSADLMNYTLAFRGDVPIAAASMHSSIYGSGTGKNTIVIIQSDVASAYLFPITFGAVSGLPNDIEVRDFHYDQIYEVYVLCGSRRSPLGTHAFVATIDVSFLNMQFMEYPEANMFYSICDPNIRPVLSNYYLCGTRGDRGVIASVDRGTLQLNIFYVTEIAWEYHKIYANPHSSGTPLSPFFVVSGRDPLCTHIGFTTLNTIFTPMDSYRWEQRTERASHCVVSDDILQSNTIILASSYQNTVTLNPVTYLISTPSVRAYHFTLPGIAYFVQDIGTTRLNATTSRISLAGFKTDLSPNIVHDIAWHGHLTRLSSTSNMINNYYNYNNLLNFYEHYKIRYQNGNEYTGGSFRGSSGRGALFATPLTLADECDSLYTSEEPMHEDIPCSSFLVVQKEFYESQLSPYDRVLDLMLFNGSCGDFKGKVLAPELVMSKEDESEIITYYDYITVKDSPSNTPYQIYSITGQLLQTGVTTPDISTAQLKKGIYILRLENGKAFKFLK